MPIYEYECRDCGKVSEFYNPVPHDGVTETCKKCGAVADRIYSVARGKVFEVFTTRHILPGGEPVTVRGPGQLRQLESEHGVKRVEDNTPPPQTAIPSAS